MKIKDLGIIILSFGIVIAGYYAHYEIQKKAYKDAIRELKDDK